MLLSIPGIVSVMVSSLASSLEYIMQKKSSLPHFSEGGVPREPAYPHPLEVVKRTHSFLLLAEPCSQPVFSSLNFLGALVSFCGQCAGFSFPEWGE